MTEYIQRITEISIHPFLSHGQLCSVCTVTVSIYIFTHHTSHIRCVWRKSQKLTGLVYTLVKWTEPKCICKRRTLWICSQIKTGLIRRPISLSFVSGYSSFYRASERKFRQIRTERARSNLNSFGKMEYQRVCVCVIHPI